MPTSRQITKRDSRTELQAWYLTSLAPKLSRATTRRVVTTAAVDALDGQIRELLDLPPAAAEHLA